MFTQTNPAIYYEKTGHGVPILFIPPPAMGHLTFRYQVLLQQHFTILTFDPRGDGDSESGEEDITLHDCLSDIVRLLKENKIEKAVICGYSNGGLLAQQFVLHYPEQAIGLILIDSFFHPTNLLLRLEYLAGIAIATYRAIPLLAKGLALSHFPIVKEAKEMERSVKKTNTALLKQQYRLGFTSNLTKHLQSIQVPLLLIYGAHDYYVQHAQYGFRKYVEDVDVAYVHLAAHQVPTRHYRECNAIIYDWMKRKILCNGDDSNHL